MYGVKQPPFHGQFCAVSSIPTQRYQNCRAALENHLGRKAGTGLELVSLGTVKSRGTVPRPSGVAFAPTAKPPAQGRGAFIGDPTVCDSENPQYGIQRKGSRQ